MYHKTVSISTSTVLPAAFFAAISAVALVVSFMAASYLYARRISTQEARSFHTAYFLPCRSF